jgi:hypothetical protein
MHCVYCGVDYNLEDGCWCLPPAESNAISRPDRVDVPWGEAAAAWSMRMARTADEFSSPAGLA